MKQFFALVLFINVCIGFAGCSRVDEAREHNTLIEMLLSERYEELDKSIKDANQQYLAGKLDSNDWAGRFLALARLGKKHDAQFNKWVEESGTGFSRLARGMHLQHEAWVARGDKPAADTTDAEWRATRQLANQARIDLLAANAAVPNCALCAGELINNNRALDERSTDRQLLDVAIRQDPKMHWPVLAYYQGIHPSWDAYDEIETFIMETHKRLGDETLVDEMKSRMYRDQARQVLQFKFRDSLDRAIGLYEKGVNRHPYEKVLEELADIHFRRGDYVRAAELLELDLKAATAPSVVSMEKLVETYIAIGQSRKANDLIARREQLRTRYPYLYME